MGGRHLGKPAVSRGFTLIEVLVVVAIIALLIAVLIPSLTRAREQTKQVACASNMHQHLNACIMYGQDYRGLLPRSATQYTNGGVSWWIDTVLASYDPNGRGVYDLRAIMKRYIGNQMDVFSCPANGGPRLDDPVNLEKALAGGYMGAQVMMYYNSTCVFQGTSEEKPWAPKQEWTAGGPPASVPIVQDEYTASGPGVTTLNKFVFNHGRSAERTNNADIPTYTNYYTSPSQAACAGANVGYLDGHTSWVKNTQRSDTKEWTLNVHWSGSALRMGGSSSSSGVPLTVKVQTTHTVGTLRLGVRQWMADTRWPPGKIREFTAERPMASGRCTYVLSWPFPLPPGAVVPTRIRSSRFCTHHRNTRQSAHRRVRRPVYAEGVA